MQNLELFSGHSMTKTQIKIIAKTIIDELYNGNIIKSIDSIAKMELLIKEIKSTPEFIDYAREEISKYGKSVTTESGTKIELAETGTKYDYSVCNDNIYDGLLQMSESIKTQLKEREDFLKTIQASGMQVLDDNTGELVTIYRPAKTSTSSYKCTISK